MIDVYRMGVAVRIDLVFVRLDSKKTHLTV